MQKDKMPTRQQLDLMKKKLARVPGTAILPPGADAVDRAKHEICRQIVLHMHGAIRSIRDDFYHSF